MSTPPGPNPPLIGLAHGSRHPGVRAAIEDLLAAVAEQHAVPVRGAFLDLTEPDLEQVAVELAAAGHRRAVVVPLLFTEAFHATVDVPEAVASAGRRTGLQLRLADILGTGDDVAAVVEDSAAAAGVSDDQALLLYAVGSSRAAANAAVADLARRLARRRTGAVEAGFGTADPRADRVLAALPSPAGVVPLFLAPGLLLDPLRATARDRDLPMAPPLGRRMAGVVWSRYRDVAG